MKTHSTTLFGALGAHTAVALAPCDIARGSTGLMQKDVARGPADMHRGGSTFQAQKTMAPADVHRGGGSHIEDAAVDTEQLGQIADASRDDITAKDFTG